MADLMAVALDVKAVPIDCLVRHAPRAVMDEKQEIVLRTEIDVVVAKYCWLVEKGKSKVWVSGDHSLPMIEGDQADDDPVEARMTQLNPVTGEVYYGPAEIRKSQYAAWVAAGIGGL